MRVFEKQGSGNDGSASSKAGNGTRARVGLKPTKAFHKPAPSLRPATLTLNLIILPHSRKPLVFPLPDGGR